MKYLMMTAADRQTLRGQLEAMPEFIAQCFAGLTVEMAALSAHGSTFAPVEQCWHLADLEREAFSVRIRRLLDETDPLLADFDGTRRAHERNYRALSLAEGIAAFRRARLDNLALLQTIASDQWVRKGRQEGVGAVALCDVPVMMAEHDATHRREIEDWWRAIAV